MNNVDFSCFNFSKMENKLYTKRFYQQEKKKKQTILIMWDKTNHLNIIYWKKKQKQMKPNTKQRPSPCALVAFCQPVWRVYCAMMQLFDWVTQLPPNTTISNPRGATGKGRKKNGGEELQQRRKANIKFKQKWRKTN